eukprot:3774483-Amphidinium_carterae.2
MEISLQLESWSMLRAKDSPYTGQVKYRSLENIRQIWEGTSWHLQRHRAIRSTSWLEHLQGIQKPRSDENMAH